MKYTLSLYRVSADGGKSWTEQWLTVEEAEEFAKDGGCICEKVDGCMKKIWA